MSDEAKHTPGPWRWEINLKSKQAQLCGGVPKFDLIVLDFVRWGMSEAAPRFRTGGDGLNIMKRADDFAVTVAGREHHAEWFRALNHPDARLIAAAPELLAILKRAESAPWGDYSWQDEAKATLDRLKGRS